MLRSFLALSVVALAAAPAGPRQSAAPPPNPFPGANRTAADAAALSGQIAPSPPAAPPRSEAARGQSAPPPSPPEPYAIAPPAPPSAQSAPKVSAQVPAQTILLIAAAIVFSFPAWPAIKERLAVMQRQPDSLVMYDLGRALVVGILTLLCLATMALDQHNPFIYFRF